MIFDKSHLARIAFVSALALAGVACAGSTEEPAGEDDAQSEETARTEVTGEADTPELPKVESNTTTPKDGIGEKGSSCPIWQCGFNGLRPDALARLATRAR